jgi:SHS2 domain-containing protein
LWLFNVAGISLNKDRLDATLQYARWPAAMASEVRMGIKAATYGGLRIEKEDKRFQARIVFDT